MPSKKRKNGAGTSAAAAAAPEPDVATILRTLENREAARAAKDFGTADRLRDELTSSGVELFDREREFKTRSGRRGRYDGTELPPATTAGDAKNDGSKQEETKKAKISSSSSSSSAAAASPSPPPTPHASSSSSSSSSSSPLASPLPSPSSRPERPPPKPGGKTEAPLSLQLYLSQLPFDTDKGRIAKHFEAKGCIISRQHGIRLLSEKGVAFVDAVDRKSFLAGLKLHRQSFGGRLINVRPAKTKDELLRIVEEKKKALAAEGLEYKVNDDHDDERTGGGKNKEQKTTNSGSKPKKQRKEDVETMEVPNTNAAAASIIGRGGEAIQALHKKTGCFAMLAKASDTPRGAPTRLLTLKGSQEHIAAARKEVRRILAAAGVQQQQQQQQQQQEQEEEEHQQQGDSQKQRRRVRPAPTGPRSTSTGEDWSCAHCGASNFASRSTCYKCQKPRSALGGGRGGGQGQESGPQAEDTSLTNHNKKSKKDVPLRQQKLREKKGSNNKKGGGAAAGINKKEGGAAAVGGGGGGGGVSEEKWSKSKKRAERKKRAFLLAQGAADTLKATP
jgi:hypothetical protein